MGVKQCVSALVLFTAAVNGFAPNYGYRTRTLQGTSKLQMFEWESVVFNAESMASDLARVGLQDPKNLASSLPVMYCAGLLTSVSPCVWGLLPLTISYISK